MPDRDLERRLYALLLRAYPRTFRDPYGEAMREHFESRLKQTRGRGPASRLRFWTFILQDLLTTAALEHRQRLARAARPRPRPTPVHHHGSRLLPLPNRSSIMDLLVRDLKYAARRLVKAPGFSLMAMLILALGIGANTAIFTLVNAFLFRPQPYESPEQLVDIYQDSDEGSPFSSSFPAYLDMTAYTDVFAGLCAVAVDFATLLGDTGAQPITVEFATASTFPVLGLQPSRGRFFEPSEDRLGAPPVAVISYRTWQTRLAADPEIVGRSLRLNGTPVTVVGVGPRDYHGLAAGLAIDFWLSLSAIGPVGGPHRAASLERRADHHFMIKGRLRPEITAAQAQGAMEALASRLAAEYPLLNDGRRITVFGAGEVRIHPAQDRILYPAATFLMVVVGLVLAVACANVANLVLVRGASRGKEIATRLALGATRGELIRHLLAESLLLAGAGGLVGALLAGWSLRLLAAYQPPLPIPVTFDSRVDGRVLLFTLALSVLTGLAAGLMPALRASRPALVAGLKEEGMRPFGRVRRLGLRNSLVVAQVAVSLVLLVGAGLLIRSLLNAQRLDLGFDPDGLAVLQTDATQGGYPPEEIEPFYVELRRRLSTLPGIEAAALTSRLPLTLWGPSNTMFIEGYESSTGTGAVEVASTIVDAGYFPTMGIPLLHGRGFAATDRPESGPVAVVSRALALHYWGTTEAVGRRLRYQAAPDRWLEVVGVVGDTKVRSHGEAPTPLLYRPFGQLLPSRIALLVRGTLEPQAMTRELSRLAQELDPDLPVFAAGPMEEILGAALFLPRIAAALLLGLGGLALLLASLGLYAVVAFAVSQRHAEMGIRMALGARSAQVVRMVLEEVMILVGLGVGLGTGLSLLGAPALSSLLYEVPPGDPATLILVSGLLLVVALGATLVPARRAARTDPAMALRCE